MAFSGGQITRLGLYGGPRRLYGAFTEKFDTTGGPHDPGRITRLGMYGGPRQVYGSFAGRVGDGVGLKHRGFTRNVSKGML